MSTCLDTTDLEELGDSALRDFSATLAGIPEDMCVPFNEAARGLEIEILAFYKMAARLAKKETELDRVAKIWESMAGICGNAISELKALHAKHPYCGADNYRDRLMDLRNKCQRLWEMHK